jgi:hypothetical protein
MDNDRLRVARQKTPCIAVELPTKQDHSYASLLIDLGQDPGEIGVHLLDQGYGFFVFDESVGALRFNGSNAQRNEQRFCHAAQVLIGVLGHVHPPQQLDLALCLRFPELIWPPTASA